MGKTYLPTTEPGLITWSNNFSQAIKDGPASYGLTAEQATAYDTLNAEFGYAYQRANDPMTGSPGNIEAKNTLKDRLKTAARALVAICQAAPMMNDDKRRALSITIRDTTPTPIERPTTAPQVEVASVVGRTVSLTLRAAGSTRRARPAGAAAAVVFSFAGDTPPGDLLLWKNEGGTTKTDPDIVFPLTVEPGTRVWITACWKNPTEQTGPACAPVATQINYGGLAVAA